MFLLKVALFPLSLLVYVLSIWICKRKCRCRRGPDDEAIDWYH